MRGVGCGTRREGILWGWCEGLSSAPPAPLTKPEPPRQACQGQSTCDRITHHTPLDPLSMSHFAQRHSIDLNTAYLKSWQVQGMRGCGTSCGDLDPALQCLSVPLMAGAERSEVQLCVAPQPPVSQPPSWGPWLCLQDCGLPPSL